MNYIDSNYNSGKLLMNVLLGQETDRIPVWFMRQAGRYLPEYMDIRKKAGSFVNLCKTPELSAQVVLQPIDRFNLDAAIIFTDILMLPDSIGFEVKFEESIGPVFNNPIRSKDDLRIAKSFNRNNLNYLVESINLIKSRLKNNITLLGFAGAPWTVASYMIGQGQQNNFFDAIRILYSNSDLLSEILEIITDATIEYLILQIDSGVDAIMLFDSSSYLLPYDKYVDFSLKYITEIIKKINFYKKNNQKTPVIVYAKDSNRYINNIIDTGCDCISLDWTIDLLEANKIIQEKKLAIQGNMHPLMLMSDKEKICIETDNFLQKCNSIKHYIFNLGHGIHKNTNPDNVQEIVTRVKNFKKIN